MAAAGFRIGTEILRAQPHTAPGEIVGWWRNRAPLKDDVRLGKTGRMWLEGLESSHIFLGRCQDGMELSGYLVILCDKADFWGRDFIEDI